MARHPAAGALALGVLVCAVALGLLLGRLRSLRAEAESAAETLQHAASLAAEHRQLQQEIRRADLRLQDPEGFDIAALEALAAEELLARVGRTQSRSSSEGEALSRRIVEFSFEQVRRKHLVEFLWQVERLDPAIRTQTLRLRPNRTDPDLVDVEVQFSAYAEAAGPRQ